MLEKVEFYFLIFYRVRTSWILNELHKNKRQGQDVRNITHGDTACMNNNEKKIIVKSL